MKASAHGTETSGCGYCEEWTIVFKRKTENASPSSVVVYLKRKVNQIKTNHPPNSWFKVNGPSNPIYVALSLNKCNLNIQTKTCHTFSCSSKNVESWHSFTIRYGVENVNSSCALTSRLPTSHSTLHSRCLTVCTVPDTLLLSLPLSFHHHFLSHATHCECILSGTLQSFKIKAEVNLVQTLTLLSLRKDTGMHGHYRLPEH